MGVASSDERQRGHLKWVMFASLMPVPGRTAKEIAGLVQRSLVPLIDRLEQTNSVRLSLHIGGAVVDYLEREARDLIPRLQGLVAEERIELVAAPFYGAPLGAVPEPDAVAQLKLDVDWLRARMDAQVRGAWLPSEGWDPVVPRLLARAGLSYTFLDRRLMPWTGPGWVAAERDGHTVGVIPVDGSLSEAVRAGDKGDLRALLRQRHASGVGLVCAAVPLSRPMHQGTPLGWLPPVLDLMRDEGTWLRPLLPGVAVGASTGGHRAALTAGLRPELGAESLPVGAAEQPLGVPWSRFLVRSEDANRLHKRMLRVSRQVQRMRSASSQARRQHMADRQVQEASLDLYQGQGAALYMPSPRGELERADVRHAAWLALARAEERARGVLGAPTSPHSVDTDGDGVPEVYVSTPSLDAVICPADGGAISEFDLPGVGNLLNTHQRQRPPWIGSVDREARLPQLVGGPQLVAVDADEVEIEDSTGVFIRPTVEDAPSGLSAVDDVTEESDSSAGSISIPPDLEDLLVDDAAPRLAFQ